MKWVCGLTSEMLGNEKGLMALLSESGKNTHAVHITVRLPERFCEESTERLRDCVWSQGRLGMWSCHPCIEW